jgi:hypothetical protein
MPQTERKGFKVVNFQDQTSTLVRELKILYKFPTPPPTITQEDLAEVEYLSQTVKSARQALAQKRRMIRFGLEHGAVVEPGLRKATLEKKARLRIA